MRIGTRVQIHERDIYAYRLFVLFHVIEYVGIVKLLFLKLVKIEETNASFRPKV